jgi:hypothetical protein
MNARSFGVTALHRDRRRLTVSGASTSCCVRLRFSDEVGVEDDVDVDAEGQEGPARAGREIGDGRVLGSG